MDSHTKVRMAQSQGDFILEVIPIDLHCHLELTVVAQQGHFGIKSTVAHSQSYYSTLIGSRMCSVQWRHPRWPWSTFQGRTSRRRSLSCEKLLPWDFGIGGGLCSLSAFWFLFTMITMLYCLKITLFLWIPVLCKMLVVKLSLSESCIYCNFE